MTDYPNIAIGICPMCGEKISLDKNTANETCQSQSADLSPLGCLARYGQERYDQGRKMRMH